MRSYNFVLLYFFFSVILGTTTGQLIVLDDHGNTTEICSVSTKAIRQLIYSCQKFYPEAPANSKKTDLFNLQ